MSSAFPSWLNEPCPAWCVRAHAETDPPDDRAHMSDAIEIPVIERVTSPTEGGIVYERCATALQIGLHRVVGESETWVYLGDGERRGFEIPLPLARELGHALIAIGAPAH